MGLLLANPYLDIILALGLAWLAVKILQAIFGPVLGLPVVGAPIAGALNSMERSLSRACMSIASGVSTAVGTSLHWFSRTIDRTYGEIRSHANLLLGIAGFLTPLAVAVAGIRALVHRLTVTGTAGAAQIKTLERELHGIEHQVKTLERDVSKGIGADVLPRLKHLDKELNALERSVPSEIANAEAQAQSATSDLWSWLTGVASRPLTLTFAGAVAVALSALGLGGLNCDNFSGKNGLLSRRACGLWSGLENLLGLFIDALVLSDLCQIIPETVAFFGAVEGVLTGLISQAANAVCAASNANWTTVDVAAGPRPPAQAFDPTTLASGG